MPGRRRVVEIETLEQFDNAVAEGARSMRGWRLQSVDLSSRSHVLRGLRAAGSVFLGCQVELATVDDLRARGALLFPRMPDVPFDPYRADLYSPRQLYDAIAYAPYDACLDARVYAWTRDGEAQHDLAAALARALHDNSIAEAFDDTLTVGELDGASLVGIMGGHATARGDASYAQAVLLGRALTRAGHTVVTGGGPGAMEAANLGAYLADATEGELAAALAHLGQVPTFQDRTTWARTASEVVQEHPQGRASIGIPTWFYGHEPPNLFATVIAKYFHNALREAVLVERCEAGIVYLPGAAGTAQEIFTDACENYYAPAEKVAPMVLLGVDHWRRHLPAWQLVQALARDRPMAERIWCVDTVAEVVAALEPAQP
ncbi:MAG: LOG family protein [Nocardioidaceae bacterium]